MVTKLAESLQDIEVLIGKVSNVTGLEAGQISKQIAEANVPAFQYEDLILISPEDFDPIIDAWAESIKQKLKGDEAASDIPASVDLDEPVAEAEEPSSSTDFDEPVDEAEESSSLTEQDDLTWPDGYENVVTHLYTPTLKKVLPKDSKQRNRFLKAIATETATGQRLAEELAKAIVKRAKRNLAYDTVLAGVKAKCAEML